MKIAPVGKWVLAVNLVFVVATLPIGDNVLMWLWPGLIYLAFMRVSLLTWPYLFALSYAVGLVVVYSAAVVMARRVARSTPGRLLLVAALAHGVLPLLASVVYLVGRWAGLAYTG